MGSKEIWKVGYRKGFAFIGVSGFIQVNEHRAEESDIKVFVA